MSSVLTEIEKLDGQHEGFVAATRMCFQDGRSASRTHKTLRQIFLDAPVTLEMVQSFRARRWVPEKILQSLQNEATRATVEAFGGNEGLDNLASAKIHEIMHAGKMSISQLISAKAVLGRFLAQELKEQEFLRKTGQLETDQEAEETPEEHEAKRKAASLRVVAQIKEIFGISTDPEPQPILPAPILPAGIGSSGHRAEEIGPSGHRAEEIGPSGHRAIGSFEEPGEISSSTQPPTGSPEEEDWTIVSDEEDDEST